MEMPRSRVFVLIAGSQRHDIPSRASLQNHTPTHDMAYTQIYHAGTEGRCNQLSPSKINSLKRLTAQFLATECAHSLASQTVSQSIARQSFLFVLLPSPLVSLDADARKEDT